MNPTHAVVYVVDDDPSFLKAVARLLRAAGYAVETFASAEDFLNRLPCATAGCVLADLNMPGLSGLDLQTALAKAENPLPMVFLTGHGDIPTTVQAMRQGAEDFLTKTAPREALLGAVRRALARDDHERADRNLRRELRARFDSLTAREFEVLAQVLQGKMNKEIADGLGLHERTVKLHRTSLTTKLRVRSVAELTRLAGQSGLFNDAAFRPGQPPGAASNIPS